MLAVKIRRKALIPVVAVSAVSSLLLLNAPPGVAAPVPDEGSSQPVVTQVHADSGVAGTVVRDRHDVTLITGDKVAVGQDAQGKPAAQVVEKTPGTISVVTFSNKDGVFVLPDKAASYVAANRLDMNLFNVSLLVKDGYDDAHSENIPLIAEYPKGTVGGLSAQAVTVPAGAQAGVDLPAASARGLSAGKAQAQDFWADVAKTATTDRSQAAPLAPLAQPESPADVQLGAGITKLWLDGKVQASLDQSVPSIGAPQAWAQGYDGKGVKIAVLDTGIDATHPDFAGRILTAQNFSDSPDTVDRVGHGTHVASTAAGSGAADGGKYKGVAPQASLLIGKVLGDDGSGSYSQIISGMQWAVSQGAKVVSMSLGGGVTDGTDPMSTAVNDLSNSSGALFVIAAGNNSNPSNGAGNRNIASPGAADAALTVGATEKTTPQVANFSSRGPRMEDFAIKPEITAPGVGIIAARANGNNLGDPVDQYYQSMSGTSMATPHVAGAAAILAEGHPDWSGQQLKSGLVNTAAINTGEPMLWHGGGRVWVPGAVNTTLTSAPSTLSLGKVEFVDQKPGLTESKNVSFTNNADQPVTLTLSATATRYIDLLHDGYTGKGDGAPGTVTVSPAMVTVPAHGSATATVTADIAASPEGVFGGYVTASQNGTPVVHLPVDYTKDIEKYRLGVHVLDRNGQPAATVNPGYYGPGLIAVDLDTGRPHWGTIINGHEWWAGPEQRTLFPKGHYALFAPLIFTHPPGEITKYSETYAAVPDITLDKDVTINLDARTAVPVAPVANKPTETQYTNVSLDVQSGAVTAGFRANALSKSGGQTQTQFAIPVAPAKTATTLRYSVQSVLTEPTLAASQVTPSRASIATARATRTQFNGHYQGPLLNVGHATPDDLAKIDVRGKAVLLQPDTYKVSDPPKYVADQLDRLYNAGALFAFIPYPPIDCCVNTNRLFYGGRTNLPAVWIDQSDADRLTAQAAQGQVTVDLNGTPENRTPFVYNSDTIQNQIPTGTTRIDLSQFAKVNARYHEAPNFSPNTDLESCWQSPAHYYPLCTPVIGSFQRTEYVQASGVDWVHDTRSNVERFIRRWGKLAPGGHLTEDVFTSPLAPCVRYVPGFNTPGSVIPGISRNGNELAVGMSGLCSPDLQSEIPAMGGPYDLAKVKIFQDGQLIGGGRPAHLIQLPADEHQYRIVADIDRNARLSAQTSIHATTEWTTRSAQTASRTPLTLPQFAWDVPVDLNNNVKVPGEVRLRIHPQHQTGAADPEFTTVTLSVSYDDGKTWQQVKLDDDHDGGWYEGTIHNQADQAGGFVSLRASATDKDGNSVTTTVTRAFGLAAAHDKHDEE